MANPTLADVQAYLTGLTIPSLFDVTSAVADAIDELEGITGRYPFVAGAADVTITLDPPKGNSGINRLVVPDFVSITILTVNVTGTYAGDVLTPNVDYVALPQVRRSGWPIEAIDFINKLYATNRRSIVIVGKQGAFAALPDRAFRGICKRVAADVIAAAGDVRGGEIRQKLGEREAQYQASPEDVTALAARYRKDWADVVSYYKRIDIL